MSDQHKTNRQLFEELKNLRGKMEASKAKAEAALSEIEDRLDETQAVANLGYYILDIDADTWTSSIQLDQIFEIESKETHHLAAWIELLHPDFREEMIEYFQAHVLQGHNRFDKEYKIVGLKSGEEKWVHGLGNLKFNQDNQPVVMFGTIQDISKRKQTEEALRQSEARYRDFFEKMPVALWEEDFSRLKTYLDELTASGVTDLNAYFQTHPEQIRYCASLVEILEINQATVNLFEADSKEQILGNLERILDQGGKDQFRDEIVCLYTEGGVFQGEIVNMSLKGKPIDCIVDVKVVAGYEDTWEKCLVSITDISARVRAEKALKKNEAKMSGIFRAAPIGIGVVIDRVLLDVNDRLCEMIGYSPEELIGNSARMLYRTDEDYEYVGKEKYQQISLYGTGTVETQFKCKDGKVIDVLLSSTPFDPADLSIGVAFTALDITERKAAQQTIIRERDRAQQYLDIAAVIILVLDKDQTVQLANPKCVEILGLPVGDILQKNWVEYFVPPDEQDMVRSVLSDFLAGKNEQFEYAENYVVAANGQRRLIAWHNKLMYDESGNISGILCSGEDITERRLAESALVSSEERLRLIVETIPNGITVLNSKGEVTFANPGAENILGLTRSSIIERKYNDPQWKIAAVDGGAFPDEKLPFQQVKNTLRPVYGVEHAIENPDGTRKILSINASPLLDDQGEFAGMVSSLSDITDRKAAEHRLHFLATHDALTEVPNRMLFLDRLEHAIFRASRANTRLGVLFVDLDGFKAVNDAFGHAVGDELLKQIARRIQRSVRGMDTVARVGGDEFLVMLEELDQPEDVAGVAQKILDAVSAPLHINSHEVFVTASIGICLYPDNSLSPDMLIQHANTAMYRAKHSGKNVFVYFSTEMVQKALERLSLGSDLRHALKNNEFKLHFQPQINALTGKVLGVEALMRWQHPTHGFLLPGSFIPLAEDNGMILPMGEWAMREACQRLLEWHGAGQQELRMSLNLSEREIKSPHLVRDIENVLRETGLAPHFLEFELTENVVFQAIEEYLPLLLELQEMGVKLSIDDFGTGYSTLHQLTIMPFDTLKIDYMFANEVIRYPKTIAIVSGIVDIAKNLGMDVIAEGIETRKQLEIYKAEGCNIVQGHYYSPAVPADEIMTMLNGS